MKIRVKQGVLEEGMPEIWEVVGTTFMGLKLAINDETEHRLAFWDDQFEEVVDV